MKTYIKSDDIEIWYIPDDHYFAKEVDLPEEVVNEIKETWDSFFKMQDKITQFMKLRAKNETQV